MAHHGVALSIINKPIILILFSKRHSTMRESSKQWIICGNTDFPGAFGKNSTTMGRVWTRKLKPKKEEEFLYESREKEQHI